MTTLKTQVKQEPLYSKKMDRYRRSLAKAVDNLAALMPSFEKNELIHELEKEMYSKILELLKLKGLDSFSPLSDLTNARKKVRELVNDSTSNIFREVFLIDSEEPDIQSVECSSDSTKRFSALYEIAQLQALCFLEEEIQEKETGKDKSER